MSVKKGDRVKMTGIMANDPNPMEVGAEGTVEDVVPGMYQMRGQIWVNWDNGRTLILLPEDPFEVIQP